MNRILARLRAGASTALYALAVPFVLGMLVLTKEGEAENPFVVRALAQRVEARKALDVVLAKAEGEARANLTAAEETEYRRLMDEVTGLDVRIEELQTADERELRAAQRASGLPAGEGVVRREPLTYERHNRQVSYFRDLGLAYVGGDQDAKERLSRHRAEMDVELPKREARAEAEFRRQLDSLHVGERRAAVERRDLTRVDGAGGDFVPPMWLMDEYAEFARAGRPFVNRVRNIPLPAGTDSINVPRITTGAQAQPQTADNALVQETDMVTNVVVCPVRTIAGQQDVALQLLEQSPIMFDEVVFMDLTADYNARLDAQALNGTGANGQLAGLLGLSGTNVVTYTDATPTVPELFPKGADALSQVASNRLRPAEIWVMAPRRWYWMTAALDANSRPLVVPVANGAYMAQGVGTGVVTEGPAGSWHGLPVILDPNMPLTLGAGTEDRVIGAKASDFVVFEGSLRTRALPEVLSGNLTVRLQVYAYCAWTGGRLPAATSIIAGTGLIAPTF